MQNKICPTMTWDDAPDTITPTIYAKIRGIGEDRARDKFKEKNFPLIPGGKIIADKEAVKLYDMGIVPKVQTKESISFLVLLELKKLNAKLNKEKGEITNEED